MARDRLQRLARRAHDQRQRDQRHHRARGEERAAEDGAALGGERQEAEEPVGEHDQAEDREHDARRAGDDLDRGLDGACEPERARVLARATPRSRRPAATAIAVPMTVRRKVPSSGSKKPPALLWSISARGWLNSSSGRRYCTPAHEHVDHDRAGDQAEADAGDPASQSPTRSRNGQVDVDSCSRTPGASRRSIRSPLRTSSSAALPPSRRATGTSPRPAAPPRTRTASRRTAPPTARRRCRRSWPRAAASARGRRSGRRAGWARSPTDPETIESMIASPSARAVASTAAAMIAGRTARTETVHITRQRLTPERRGALGPRARHRAQRVDDDRDHDRRDHHREDHAPPRSGSSR